MRLYLKMLVNDVIEIDVPSSVTLWQLYEAAHEACPEWPVSRMKLFSLDSDHVDCASLRDGDWLGLYVYEERYVKIVSGADQQYFSVEVSSQPTFTYPHTRSIFFEFNGGPFMGRFLALSKTYYSLEEMIRSSREYAPEYHDRIVEQAVPLWEEIMSTYQSRRAEYLLRREVVRGVDD